MLTSNFEGNLFGQFVFKEKNVISNEFRGGGSRAIHITRLFDKK